MNPVKSRSRQESLVYIQITPYHAAGKQNRATMSGINGMYSRVVLQYRKGPARPG